MITDCKKYELYLNLILSSELPEIKKIFQDHTDKEIISSIFVVVRLTKDSTNFKLTSFGHYILSLVMQVYEVDLKDDDIFNLKGKTLLKFDKILTAPWIIQANKLFIFDEEIAFNFAMAETIHQFISLYE